ncbi:amidohydrolase family protein [Barrientosiimonas marina]|uniref:Amidohydrolase n=1 Tax=Lentibacillus kimchii TaxID=1542911 RepID=A0ABW2UUA0_9BACI
METLYYGGSIITMNHNSENVEAVLIDDWKIKEVGTLEVCKASVQHDDAKMIDLQGKTLMPSFIDPHSHMSLVGPVAEMCDLHACNNFDDIVSTLKSCENAKGADAPDVILGFGYDHNFLDEGEHPTKHVLNQVSVEKPVLIMHASGHVGSSNDATLTKAGIDRNTPDAEGGHIGREDDSMEPNGYLEEANLMELRHTVLSGQSFDFYKLAVKGQDVYTSNGITTVQDGATGADSLELLKALSENEQLKVDVVAYPTIADNQEGLSKNQAYVKNYYKRLKINGYKMFLDGSPQGKTAWMTEPYAGEDTYRGYPSHSDEQVKDYARQAIYDNVQLLTHCNGDAASDQLLQNYEAALEETGDPHKNYLRPVMIHAQTVRNDQLDKMAELAMIPSIFNAHTYYWGDIHLKNLGDKRGRRISPAKSAFDRGLVVNFHQDSPVIKPDMLHTIWSAVNRTTRQGQSIGPEERVDVYDALKAVTINAAYAYFEEDQKGSITKGKLADLVILDQNPLAIDKDKLKDIQIVETIKEGETIYQANE